MRARVQGCQDDGPLLRRNLPAAGSEGGALSDFLTQREPGPVAIQKGLDALIAGLNRRDPGRRWYVVSPRDRLEGPAAVGAGDVDGAGVVRPDDEHAVGDGGAARTSADEHVANHPAEEVA